MAQVLGTTGDDLFDNITGGIPFNSGDTLVGGLGNDVYNIGSLTSRPKENPGEGIDTVRVAYNYSLHPNVERLELIGSDPINGTGNDLDNYILGNSAANRLDSGIGGKNTLEGGLGDDTYVIHNLQDVVIEAPGAGYDSVRSHVSFDLSKAGLNVERLVLLDTETALSGIGNAGDNYISGNSFSNFLRGGAGNDTLFGGPGGSDTLQGDAGNDTYIVRAGDVITGTDSGIDTVEANISWVLGSQQENLNLTGTQAINGTGHGGNNYIRGNAANNRLDGGGGLDTLEGGRGNDTYVVRTGYTIPIIIENPGAEWGIDTIESTISITALPNNVENLTLLGTGQINGTGNILNNVISGNGTNNIIDGGIGADTMIGGVGADTYYVDEPGDVVIEAPNEGIDAIYSSVNVTLLANNVENLYLTGTAFRATGNTLSNSIIGNSGDNLIVGSVSPVPNEVDNLTGGGGADTFVLGDATRVFYNTSGGTDFARISDFSMAQGDRLQLRGSASDYTLINSSPNARIFLGNDLIAIIQNGASMGLSLSGSEFVYVSQVVPT